LINQSRGEDGYEAALAELIGTIPLVFVGTATAVFAGAGILARSNYETGEIASARRGLTDQQ
jgi:hypothetical protein